MEPQYDNMVVRCVSGFNQHKCAFNPAMGLWLGLHGSFCEETATKNINNLPDWINKTGIEPEKWWNMRKQISKNVDWNE